MIRNRLGVIIAAMMLAACGSEDGAGPAGPSEPSPESAATETSDSALNVGDVEQQTWIVADVALKSQTESVSIDALEDARKKLNLVTVTVTPPHPESFWVDIRLNTLRSFETNPVVLRARYSVSAEYPGEEEAVEVEMPGFMEVVSEQVHKSSIEQIDILAQLPGVPETLLFKVEADAILSKYGTDAASLDPETAEAPPARTTTLLSNPLRVNFVSEETQE